MLSYSTSILQFTLTSISLFIIPAATPSVIIRPPKLWSSHGLGVQSASPGPEVFIAANVYEEGHEGKVTDMDGRCCQSLSFEVSHDLSVHHSHILSSEASQPLIV